MRLFSNEYKRTSMLLTMLLTVAALLLTDTLGAGVVVAGVLGAGVMGVASGCCNPKMFLKAVTILLQMF